LTSPGPGPSAKRLQRGGLELLALLRLLQGLAQAFHGAEPGLRGENPGAPGERCGKSAGNSWGLEVWTAPKIHPAGFRGNLGNGGG